MKKTVVICDLCQANCEGEQKGIKLIAFSRVDGVGLQDEYDLCTDCLKSIEEHIRYIKNHSK